MTKYNSNSYYGVVDNLTTLELEHDAAYKSDKSCRIPTNDECQELIDNTISTWETLNGVNGMRFISNINSNSIFVPAAGGYLDGNTIMIGYIGSTWSSSICDNSQCTSSCGLAFDSNGMIYSNSDRCGGIPIRAVKR